MQMPKKKKIKTSKGIIFLKVKGKATFAIEADGTRLYR